MKKIKTQQQLTIERQRWQQRQHELESKLSDDLQRLQKAASPTALIKDAWNSIRKPSAGARNTASMVRSAAATTLFGFLIKRMGARWRKGR